MDVRDATLGLAALCGVVLLAAAVPWAGAHIGPPTAGVLASAAPASAGEGALDQPPANPVRPPEHPARPVAPDVVSPAIRQDLALERIAPRPPLSLPAEEDRTPRPTLLHRPVASAAGRIEAGGHMIEIAGLNVVEPDRLCAGARDGKWPCGSIARTAFRNWLRGRAVECFVSDKPQPMAVRVSCSLGQQDIGAWLAEQGFAEAAPAGPYAAKVEQARAARKGIWGEGPSLE